VTSTAKLFWSFDLETTQLRTHCSYIPRKCSAADFSQWRSTGSKALDLLKSCRGFMFSSRPQGPGNHLVDPFEPNGVSRRGVVFEKAWCIMISDVSVMKTRCGHEVPSVLVATKKLVCGKSRDNVEFGPKLGRFSAEEMEI
jgi:hypothetical protein